MISPEIDDLLSEMESSGESAALAVSDHLRLVANNGEDSASTEHLRAEAENVIAWAATFLRETGGIPPDVLRQLSSAA